MIETKINGLWLFDNYHRLSGAPVAEGLLMDQAVDLLLGAEVREIDFPRIVKHLEKLQEDILPTHPRCKKCEIILDVNEIIPDAASLCIGSGHLSLTKVKKTLIFPL